MRKLGIQAAILALVIAPLAAHAAETARPNPKLPEAVTAAPLVPKAATPEARMSYACVFGQAGGAALSLMLGSSRFWDALTDAVLGHNPRSAEQRAFCALGEALAPHVATAAEGVAEELLAGAQRQAEAAQKMMTVGSAQMQQALAGFLDVTAEKSARASSEFTQLCEGSARCAWLSDTTANTWSRLWPIR